MGKALSANTGPAPEKGDDILTFGLEQQNEDVGAFYLFCPETDKED
jgi:hypothetical protein